MTDIERPSSRVQAALEELAAALQDQYGDEVSGYSAGRLSIGSLGRPGVPTAGFCLFRNTSGDTDTCGIYDDSDGTGAPDSCTVYFYGG